MVVGTSAVAQSDDYPERFCLSTPQDIFRYGCVANPIPNRVSKVVECRNEARIGTEIIEDASAYEAIAAGEGGCNPWSPPPDEVLGCDVPRRPDGSCDLPRDIDQQSATQ